jgi:hypothetical protein
MPASHDAFISYSHQADAALAPVLERGIERLARATFQLRAIDVFRDQTSLSASPGVWTGIREHLAGSRWFIFLASPKAAASPWCGKELHWWLEERGTAQLLIVLTDGTIEWDGAGGDFDWTRTDALPRDAMAGQVERCGSPFACAATSTNRCSTWSRAWQSQKLRETQS